MPEDPFAEVHNRAFPFTKETLAELVNIIPEPYSDAVKIGVATGLRPSELMGLSKQGIDFQSSVIRLSLKDATSSYGPLKRGPLKTRWSSRSITFGPELRALLLPLYNSPGPDGRLFHEDGKMRARKFRYMWTDAKLLLPEIGPGLRQLRHYHASVLIVHGFSPMAGEASLGQNDANETLRTYGTTTVQTWLRLQTRLWRPSIAKPPKLRHKIRAFQCLQGIYDYPE